MNPDPVALVREYVRRDNLGEFLQGNAWLDSAYVCPDHLPGPDSFTVVADATIVGQQLGDSIARVIVESAVIGEMSQDSIGFVFLRGAATKVDTFVVDHTPYGWRMSAPGLPENVERLGAFPSGADTASERQPRFPRSGVAQRAA